MSADVFVIQILFLNSMSLLYFIFVNCPTVKVPNPDSMADQKNPFYFLQIEQIYKAENENESSQEVAKENSIETNNEPVGEKSEQSIGDIQKDEATTIEVIQKDEATTIVDAKSINIEKTNADNAQTVEGENIPAPNDENIANGDNEELEKLFPQANEYRRMLPRLLRKYIPVSLPFIITLATQPAFARKSLKFLNFSYYSMPLLHL